MQTYKRSIVMQMAIFLFFFIYGLNDILGPLIARESVYKVIQVIAFLGVIIGGIIWYKKTLKTDIVVITEKEMNKMKYTLYVISGALIVGIIASGMPNIIFYFRIFSGAVICLTALYGFYLGHNVIK